METGKPELNFTERLFDLQQGEIVAPVYTFPRQELRFIDFCNANGIVSYVPLKKEYKVQRQRHGLKEYHYPREVMRPMFPNYAFARLNQEQRSRIFRSNAVVRILPVYEPDLPRLLDEIRTVHQIEMIALDEPMEFNAEVREGEHFVIESGPWSGICGWLKKKNKAFLWTVEIECIGGLVQATIDPSIYKMSRAD